MRPAASVLLPLVASLALHGAVAAVVRSLPARRPEEPQVAITVAVVDKIIPPPVVKEAPKPPEPPKPKPVPLKLARAPKPKPVQDLPPPPQDVPPPVEAPPPPTQEAKTTTPAPVVVTGITLESTSEGGSMSVGVGNTLRGDPGRKAVDPGAVHPYKAERYAPSAQVTELPQLRHGEIINLRKYYPPLARKKEVEGDVVLRLLIDGDGQVVKADIVSDPGEGLGAAAVQAAMQELRFSPAKVNGVAVATTIPFTLHFILD